MKNHAICPIIALAFMTLASCGNNPPSAPSEILIALSDNASDAQDSPGVEITSDAIVIKTAGAYVLSGTLTNGKVRVDADGDVTLTFNGVHITSNNGSPVAMFGSGEKTLALAKGSVNTLNSAAPPAEEADATLYAEQALAIHGSGGLAITSERGNGIVCAELSIEDAALAVTAKQNGIVASQSVRIKGAGTALNIKTDGGFDSAAGFTETYTLNGIVCDGNILVEKGSVDVSSASGGIKAGSAAGAVVISGGSVNIQSNGNAIHSDGLVHINGGTLVIPNCFEGVEASQVIIDDGDISIDAYDDGINLSVEGNGSALETECDVRINGGNVTITCTAGDCIDANVNSSIGELFIYGGVIHAVSHAKTSFHSQVGMYFNGGTVIALQRTTFSQIGQAVSSDSLQCVFVLKQTRSAPAKITIQDEDGQIALNASDFDMPFKTLIISTPELEKGHTYSIYKDGEIAAPPITLLEAVSHIQILEEGEKHEKWRN